MENHNKQGKTKKTWFIGLSSIFVMLVLLSFIMNSIVMPIYTKHGIEEEVPDVTEMTLEEAEGVLGQKGLRIFKDREKFDSIYPAGTIIFQNPPPFSKVKRARRIYVTVSAGEKRATVPRIIGMSERNAKFQLREVGLVVGEIYYKYSNYHPKGVVCGQSIPENEEIAEKTVVDFTLSQGSDKPSRFFVPKIVGESYSSAKQRIRQAGLNVGKVVFKIKKDLIPGTVIKQSIPPERSVPFGTKMDLVVSRLEEETWHE